MLTAIFLQSSSLKYLLIMKMKRKHIGVVSTGSAAEHSLIGMLNFSFL